MRFPLAAGIGGNGWVCVGLVDVVVGKIWLWDVSCWLPNGELSGITWLPVSSTKEFPVAPVLVPFVKRPNPWIWSPFASTIWTSPEALAPADFDGLCPSCACWEAANLKRSFSFSRSAFFFAFASRSACIIFCLSNSLSANRSHSTTKVSSKTSET